jgi:hypothetical protein
MGALHPFLKVSDAFELELDRFPRIALRLQLVTKLGLGPSRRQYLTICSFQNIGSRSGITLFHGFEYRVRERTRSSL